MARTFCEVQILGYIGKDPEIRSTDGGLLIANYSVATTEKYKKQSGEQVEKTEWHNLVSFGRGAEIVRDYVKKGALVLVKGKLQTTSWDDKESGKKQQRTVVVVHSVNLMPGKDSNQNGKNCAASDTYVDGYDTQDMADVPF